ncbi:MAG: formimidoylglutamate deiminase [Rhodoferax sp.]|nr:formimidoylglutamate deiminase [Rhodoferax sp.]
MHPAETRFFAPQAWVNGAWADDVLLSVDATGHWCGIAPGAPPSERTRAQVLTGPVLPGVVNAHSHAFQRAMAGLTEQRSVATAASQDDFWSWRQRMYAVALRISPDQLEHIAALLYTELLAGGYTQVCEFHYLHNAALGAPAAPALDMSMALVRAAQRVGMGITLLPTLYLRSGFGAHGLRADQQRFASTPASVCRLVDDVQAQTQGMAHVNVGVAVHSLRAADGASVAELAQFADQRSLPVHIHIAEQQQEIADCIAHTGQRPVQWLLDNLPVHAAWNLVHATHTNPQELAGIAQSGASVVICPSTEANLGDGVFDFGGYCALQGRWSVGSDSHVTRRWSEELRLLEYGQRLVQKKRNVAAHCGPSTSSAANLLNAAVAGGQAATALPLGGIEIGHRADFLVLDSQAPALLGVPAHHVLDAQVFSSPDAAPQAVFVAGRAVEHRVDSALCGAFAQAMAALWQP